MEHIYTFEAASSFPLSYMLLTEKEIIQYLTIIGPDEFFGG